MTKLEMLTELRAFCLKHSTMENAETAPIGDLLENVVGLFKLEYLLSDNGLLKNTSILLGIPLSIVTLDDGAELRKLIVEINNQYQSNLRSVSK